jgi:hypothetical protein
VPLGIRRHRVSALPAERVYYSPHIEVLEPDHPERRFVAALCLYSHAVDTRRAGLGFYDPEDVERFARALLMPGEEFVPVAGWSNTELAELLLPRSTRSPSAAATRATRTTSSGRDTSATPCGSRPPHTERPTVGPARRTPVATFLITSSHDGRGDSADQRPIGHDPGVAVLGHSQEFSCVWGRP